MKCPETEEAIERWSKPNPSVEGFSEGVWPAICRLTRFAAWLYYEVQARHNETEELAKAHTVALERVRDLEERIAALETALNVGRAR